MMSQGKHHYWEGKGQKQQEKQAYEKLCNISRRFKHLIHGHKRGGHKGEKVLHPGESCWK